MTQKISYYIQCINARILVLTSRMIEASLSELQTYQQEIIPQIHALEKCLLMAQKLQKDIDDRIKAGQGMDMMDQSHIPPSKPSNVDVVFIPYAVESKGQSVNSDTLIISSDIDNSSASSSTMESIKSATSRQSPLNMTRIGSDSSPSTQSATSFGLQNLSPSHSMSQVNLQKGLQQNNPQVSPPYNAHFNPQFTTQSVSQGTSGVSNQESQGLVQSTSHDRLSNIRQGDSFSISFPGSGRGSNPDNISNPSIQNVQSISQSTSQSTLQSAVQNSQNTSYGSPEQQPPLFEFQLLPSIASYGAEENLPQTEKGKLDDLVESPPQTTQPVPVEHIDLDELLKQPLKPVHATLNVNINTEVVTEQAPTNQGLSVLDELLKYNNSSNDKQKEMIQFSSAPENQKDKILNLFSSFESKGSGSSINSSQPSSQMSHDFLQDI